MATMEGGSKVATEGGDGRPEGEDIVKKKDLTRWMNALDCPNPLISPSLALALMLMEGNKTKEGGDGRQEEEGVIVKKQHVAMGMDVLECPVCFTPLRTPIFQCSMGHLVCSACHDKLPKKACSVCSRAVLNRCHGMERVVSSIVVPCSYALHGCAGMIAYHQKREHEESCRHAPCFCPEKGCGFVGSTEALLDHFTDTHEWPTARFQYYVPFEVPVKASVHVLRGGEDGGHLFLLCVASLDSSLLHGVSLVRVDPHARQSKSGCSVGFSLFKGHYQASTLATIRSTTLSDGLPMDYFLAVPEASCQGGARVVLSVTIDTEPVYGEEDELEEDDGDESYNKEDDDDDYDDSDDDGEEDDDSDDNNEDDEDGGEEEDDDDEDSWEEVRIHNDD